jgi:hypothetical protein
MRYKLFLILFLLIISAHSFAQITLGTKDMMNLVAMSEFYSLNTINKNPQFAKSIDSLRTPILNKLADAMLLMNKGDASVFSSKYFLRPDNFEMTLWYVVREVHYNRTNKTRKPRPDIDVAKETVVKQIDERWLLDNYYYRILGGVGTLLNTTDLSTTNIDLEQLGLKSETEKAIVYLNIIESLIGGRFIGLLKTNSLTKILSFCEKLPQFNGKWYYQYKDFNFEDFEYPGFEKMESYFLRHLDKLYNVLIAHYNAAPNIEYQHEFYYNSMMNEPKYFAFSYLQSELQSIYDNPK